MNKVKNPHKIWLDAKSKILGGNSLFSKNPDLYLPEGWPTYYKKAKGVYIWDLNNKKYIDMSNMSVGACVLGYDRREVTSFVTKGIKNGNMSTLNSYEEYLLANRLLDLHNWAGMVKFARSGGEANVIAIRIARSFAKSNKVAICGYHGWHDWYLSAALNKNDNLDSHLMRDLKFKGVPEFLKNTTFPFIYGNYEQFKELYKKEKFGIVKMEVCRSTKPDVKYLKKIRSFCNKNKIVLIFDECTTGFRECLGGLHKLINVNPDIVVYGKALGNGHPITAVVGKKKIMNCSDKTFISSTFWTERSGYCAALKTIEIMKKEKSHSKVIKNGNKIRKIWNDLSNKHSLDIEISGITSLSILTFKSKFNDKFKTFLTQEMLKSNILASNGFFSSACHTDYHFKVYKKALDKIFQKLKKIKTENEIDKLLKYKVAQTTFRRMN